MGRAEIDTNAPFRSVKEAVSLFADKILLPGQGGGESENVIKDRCSAVTLEAQLRETKETLKKAVEHNKALSLQLKTLTEELETTKRDLIALKTREFDGDHPVNPDVEDIKLMENPGESITQVNVLRSDREEDIERRRSVKFARPPLLTKVIMSKEESALESNKLILKKQLAKKMRPLVPLAGWLFTRNRV